MCKMSMVPVHSASEMLLDTCSWNILSSVGIDTWSSTVVFKCVGHFAPSSGFLWMTVNLVTWKPDAFIGRNQRNREGVGWGGLWLVNHPHNTVVFCDSASLCALAGVTHVASCPVLWEPWSQPERQTESWTACCLLRGSSGKVWKAGSKSWHHALCTQATHWDVLSAALLKVNYGQSTSLTKGRWGNFPNTRWVSRTCGM